MRAWRRVLLVQPEAYCRVAGVRELDVRVADVPVGYVRAADVRVARELLVLGPRQPLTQASQARATARSRSRSRVGPGPISTRQCPTSSRRFRRGKDARFASFTARDHARAERDAGACRWQE